MDSDARTMATFSTREDLIWCLERPTTRCWGGADRYYDSSSFVIQEAGTLGDLARTTLIGPGYANLDLAVTKNTQLTGGDQPVSLQFRAEFFNILNRANFGFPDPSLFEQPRVNTDNPIRRGAAGRITKTVTTSRQIQFGLKILF